MGMAAATSARADVEDTLSSVARPQFAGNGQLVSLILQFKHK